MVMALGWGCAEQPSLVDLGPGVAGSLARQRAASLSQLSYDIRLEIPGSLDEPIRAVLLAGFEAAELPQPLALDFTSAAERVLSLRANGRPGSYEVRDEHVLVDTAGWSPGAQQIEIEFLAGDGSLNRSDEFLYTLFVPDRARVALPVFDQPDLKARVRLTLEIPVGWEAVANGPLESRESDGERQTLVFAETEPISTYLMAFAAGRFQVAERERAGRRLRLLHRETDRDKVERNLEAIFDLHGRALEWLESYTAIDYPFSKLDFVALPAFQYGGMEHPGAIFYRDRGLFLDETATQNQHLGRASLIAHEVAHMWFGNLVTMRWFDDVWMKEVFANFMAAKIVNPSFPEVDHDLRFLLAHYPPAYRVDRTAGANPIRQQLDNLNDAGSLYGAIIYQKAPIVMQHLELLTGEEVFRDGLRRYLDDHRYANATWPDLIEVLDALTEEDLVSWSRIWVEEAGRPMLRAEVDASDETGVESAGPARIESIRIEQTDPAGAGRIWNQHLQVLLGHHRQAGVVRPLHLKSSAVDLSDVRGLEAPAYLLINGGGVGYGEFELDAASRDYLLQNLPTVPDARVRAVAWLSLWDGLLAGTVAPAAVADLALRALPAETDELNIERILRYLGEAYWRYLDSAARDALAPDVERVLWRGIEAASRPTLKGAYFAAFRDTALTEAAMRRLQSIWAGDDSIDGLPLSENDTTQLAQQLALRSVPDSEEILRRQAERISNPDSVERFTFVTPALSGDAGRRDRFFTSLADPANRAREPWVLEALRLLHHPLRAASARRYIEPGLELLEEIQVTGDIFFPLGWLEASLGGHSSNEAATIVQAFLDRRQDLPPRLRGKLLQAADPLLRAARLQATEDPGRGDGDKEVEADPDGGEPAGGQR